MYGDTVGFPSDEDYDFRSEDKISGRYVSVLSGARCVADGATMNLGDCADYVCHNGCCDVRRLPGRRGPSHVFVVNGEELLTVEIADRIAMTASAARHRIKRRACLNEEVHTNQQREVWTDELTPSPPQIDYLIREFCSR